MHLPSGIILLLLLLSLLTAAAALSGTGNNRPTSTGGTSGGAQYVHQQESSNRQFLLHQCFRQSSLDAFHMSGIMHYFANNKSSSSKKDSADNPDHHQYRILEIGCGAGHTTLDLLDKELPLNVEIVAIDADATMISDAKNRFVEDRSNTNPIQRRKISFYHQTGESMAANNDDTEGSFDVVWLRFVVVHVPKPEELLRAAVACLKPGGILLVEDTCTTTTAGASSSAVCDPPLFAHEFFHERHCKATLQLGGDLSRGAKIGNYMSNLGLHNVHCNSFAPIFGKGVEVQPWTSNQNEPYSHNPNRRLPREMFDAALNLLDLSLRSLIVKLKEMRLCSDEEAEQAQASMDECKKRIYSADDPASYQILSLPDGTIFQWWANK